MSEWLNDGPFPVLSRVEKAYEEDLDDTLRYLRLKGLPTTSLIPLVAHIVVPDLRDNIPAMFARATESLSAPLTVYEDTERSTRTLHVGREGLLCILPSALSFGVQALAVHVSKGGGDWFPSELTMLAPEPENVLEMMQESSLSYRPVSGVRAVKDIPLLTPDQDVQQSLVDIIERSKAEQPASFDRREILLPGITIVHPRDGNSLRENYDELTAHAFVAVAQELSLNPSIGKGLYGRILEHIANRELLKIRKTLPPDEYQSRAQHVQRCIDSAKKRSATDIIWDHRRSSSFEEITLDTDITREVAISVSSGHLTIEGITPAMRRAITHMFEL